MKTALIIGFVIFAITVIGFTAKAMYYIKQSEKTPEPPCKPKKLEKGNFCTVQHEGKEKKGKISYRSHNGRLKIRLAANHYIWRWERDVWPIK